NLMTESGELLTLHRQGSGFGPGGWVLRRAQFDALCGGLCGNERPQVVAQGIRLGRFTVKQPQRYCLLRITPPAHPQPLAVAWMQRAEETGLFGPLALAASDRCLLNYASFVTVFRPRSMALRPTGGTGWVKAPD
ncbi:hypothetical protein, partial [Pseudomonas aeruginosa]|uniref:hypothetical protein n=1 Tax=Pseudomonas aeruginosa TaxID=287 RepID=UPI0031B6E88C